MYMSFPVLGPTVVSLIALQQRSKELNNIHHITSSIYTAKLNYCRLLATKNSQHVRI